jgi:flagellin
MEATVGLNSVNTNYGALVALQSLNNTNQQLANVQKRVSTGYRINDAVDDGAAFAVAQGIRSNIGSLNAVNQQLNIARGTNGVALEAATSISNTLIKMREVTTKLADANLSTDQRRQYNADLSRLVGEVGNFISNATFNGSNLLQSAAAPIQVIANVAGTQFTLTSQDLSASLLGGGTNLLTVAFANAVAAGAALSANGSQATAESIVSTFLNNLGGDSRRLVNQVNFNAALLKASEEAVGYIVDADLAKESSRLSALQVRQQLGTQTLGIANQSPQVLLGLFR